MKTAVLLALFTFLLVWPASAPQAASDAKKAAPGQQQTSPGSAKERAGPGNLHTLISGISA
jgi:hypothetical protein